MTLTVKVRTYVHVAYIIRGMGGGVDPYSNCETHKHDINLTMNESKHISAAMHNFLHLADTS